MPDTSLVEREIWRDGDAVATMRETWDGSVVVTTSYATLAGAEACARFMDLLHQHFPAARHSESDEARR